MAIATQETQEISLDKTWCLDGRTWSVDLTVNGRKVGILARLIIEWDTEVLEECHVERLEELANKTFEEFLRGF